ncbi:hypothetical protein AVEN_19600-1 [Araneus ventricosus]|uniref:Uncharacterized protein n=1 Tax=Araneus ventricosus TaxID=182803 RepID=A0A4Y2KUG5_ARAVE|nr:hypothetical protein AVEN_19600-1 [Araneus ventricosus]
MGGTASPVPLRPSVISSLNGMLSAGQLPPKSSLTTWHLLRERGHCGSTRVVVDSCKIITNGSDTSQAEEVPGKVNTTSHRPCSWLGQRTSPDALVITDKCAIFNLAMF